MINKDLLAVADILNAAKTETTKAKFVNECLACLIELFDGHMAMAWLSTGEVYTCQRPENESETIWPAAQDDAPRGDTSYFVRNPEAAAMEQLPLPPVLQHRRSIFWSADLPRAARSDSNLGGQFPFGELLSRQQVSLLGAFLDFESALSGGVLVASRRSNHFNSEGIDRFERISEIFNTAFINWFRRLALVERVKELSCLYQMAQVVNNNDQPLEEILLEIAQIIPSALLYPDNAHAKIVFNGLEVAPRGFPKGRPKLTADIITDGQRRGSVAVTYDRNHPQMDEGPFLVEERSLLDTIARELTMLIERKRHEKEKGEMLARLQHADRLNMIGQLSASVAHEINEPLTAILGYAQLAAKCPNLPSQAQEDISKIVSTSLYAREVVRKLLLFTRKMPAKKEVIDIGGVLIESLGFFDARCHKENIMVETDLASDLPPLTADPNQLRQVFSNLIFNAIQAMPRGGRLMLKTFAADQDTLVSVEDTGCGMSAEVRSKIFIPFYTTKAGHQGTGLGLPVVQEIVTAHGGSLRVLSEENRGTTIILRFPSGGRTEMSP